jgi:peptidylprolyl isomerase domain and WD repeat-containing protein 1
MPPAQGDITLRLFPDECPRTVENFTTHATNGYYDNVIFHRVIKGFMLQTGDPLGETARLQLLQSVHEYMRLYCACRRHPQPVAVVPLLVLVPLHED